jgi:antitoxin YefM
MRATSFSDLRKNLATVLDQVNDDHEPVIITRSGGKPSAVLMSADDFASWQETAYLTRNPANLKELRAALAEVEAGKAVERKLID